MPVSFSQFPANWRLPLYYVEVDPSKAGFPVSNLPALLIGHNLAAGTGDDNVPVAVGSREDVQQIAGVGSMLDAMADKFFQSNFAHELWVLPVPEPSGGVKATGTITVSSAPTEAGTIYVYVAGRRVEVGITAEDTVDDVASAITDAINDDASMPVTASFDSGNDQVDLECKWKGATGNDIDVRVNYGGTRAAERMPAGLVLTISNSGKLSGGTGVPDLTTGIANMGDELFEFVACAFTDSTSFTRLDEEYGFGDNGRWGWQRQLYGHVFMARRDTYAGQLTWGQDNNSGVISVLDVEVECPTPVWEWAASYAAQSGRALLNDPARPLQTLPLLGCLPAPKHQRRALLEMNALAGRGIATQAPDAAGVPRIRRESTTYQRNLYDQPDDAYELVPTLATLAALFRRQKQAITSKYPRHKLANDGTRFGPGQAIVTPKIIKAELIAQYRQDEFVGLVEDGDNFKKNLIVERDPNNPNRLNVLYPPDLVNQLRIFAVLAQFRLQYNRGVDLDVSA